MFGKERPAEKELPGQRFGPADIAIRLDPHTAGGFPSAFRYFALDSPEQLRIILPDVLIQLRLTLSERVLAEFIHQGQDRMKRSSTFSSGLPQWPEPRHVNVCMADGRHIDIQTRTGLC